ETTALHQLFFKRLVDSNNSAKLGGRYCTFYQGRRVKGPNFDLPWEQFETLKWTINGVTYAESLRDLFNKSLRLLAPPTLSQLPVIISHGDAHNANIWVEASANAPTPKLVLFDPAFAGDDIPALLGEIKATFHNIFAHPFWLYTPELAEKAFSL